MNEVVFRRIRGRIIPIKRKENNAQGNSKVSSIATAAGVAVAAVGGAVSASLDRTHATLYNTARNARSDMFARKFASKTRLEGIRAHIAAKRIKKGSAFIGSSLIGLGVHRALDKSDLNEVQKGAIATASGLGANFAFRTIYTKVIGNTSLRFAAKHAFERILMRGHKL